MKSRLVNFMYRAIGKNALYALHKHQHKDGIKFALHFDKDIFFHVPKCAGTSINKVRNTPDMGHITYSDLVALTNKEQLRGRRKFIIVRNPADRLISTYRYAKRKYMKNSISILSWIAEIHSEEAFVDYVYFNQLALNHYFFRPAVEFISGIEEEVVVLDFSRLEKALSNFDFDWAISMPKLNQTIPEPIPEASLLNISSKSYEIYHKDLELYNSVSKSQDAFVIIKPNMLW